MEELTPGCKVTVKDEGLEMLYQTMKKIDPSCKRQNCGWVDEICDDGTIMVRFPIGDDDPDKHSQIAPYPSNLVFPVEPATRNSQLKIYTDTELELIFQSARQGYSLEKIARLLEIQFQRLKADYDNPALEVRQMYDDGLLAAEGDNMKNMQDSARGGKEAVKAQTSIKWSLESTRLRNKMDEIDYHREHEDL